MSKSDLEKCCECIMKVFHQYSIQNPHHDRLSNAEFSKMLKEQLPNYIQSTKNDEAINRLFQELDKNKDNDLSFEEFMTLLARFLIQCHDNFHHHH